jgi:hypothetical protein
MGEVLRETRRQIRKAQDHSARPGVAPEAAAVKHNHTAITAISLAAIPLTVLGPMTQVEHADTRRELDLFLTREAAEDELREILLDEPDWKDVLRVEPIQFDAQQSSFN